MDGYRTYNPNEVVNCRTGKKGFFSITLFQLSYKRLLETSKERWEIWLNANPNPFGTKENKDPQLIQAEFEKWVTQAFMQIHDNASLLTVLSFRFLQIQNNKITKSILCSEVYNNLRNAFNSITNFDTIFNFNRNTLNILSYCVNYFNLDFRDIIQKTYSVIDPDNKNGKTRKRKAETQLEKEDGEITQPDPTEEEVTNAIDGSI